MALFSDDIDEHGQLFLSGTKIRNFTSCYKDPHFLDFFYSRLKPLSVSSLPQAIIRPLHNKGYTFISLCGIERNFVRSQDTPVVFRLLQQDADGKWYLHWAGTMKEPFRPAALKVDTRGYLYHPSPPRHTKLFRKPSGSTEDERDDTVVDSFSLIRSEVVTSLLGEKLSIDQVTSGCSLLWENHHHPIGTLADTEVTRGSGWN